MRTLCVVIGFAAAFLAEGCSGSSDVAPGTIKPMFGTVQYSVLGTAKHVTVTYRDSSGAVVKTAADVPFFYQWITATAGEPLFISAQIDTAGDAGTVTVTVLKNAAAVQEVQATGYPNTATASGTF